jgi:hypothetical protein
VTNSVPNPFQRNVRYSAGQNQFERGDEAALRLLSLSKLSLHKRANDKLAASISRDFGRS